MAKINFFVLKAHYQPECTMSVFSWKLLLLKLAVWLVTWWQNSLFSTLRNISAHVVHSAWNWAFKNVQSVWFFPLLKIMIMNSRQRKIKKSNWFGAGERHYDENCQIKQFVFLILLFDQSRFVKDNIRWDHTWSARSVRHPSAERKKYILAKLDKSKETMSVC